MGQLKRFDYGKVRLTEPYCENAFKKEIAYLKSLDAERLLVGFRETAGYKTDAQRYPGWENTEIQGHTLGHYLSALAQAVAYREDAVLKERLIYICEALKECQRADGYLFASPEEIFDRVENHQPAWVPWYTLHKIFEGLILAYQLTHLQVAYEVADKLGDWVYKRSQKWTPELQKQVLSVEYGGMNDCLYDLYLLTGKEEHRFAAHQFNEITLFDQLYKGEDVLNGLHANATIPKIIGALKAYIVTGERYFFKVAENFWDMVTLHHSYITGGNSEWEHFGVADILEEERTACNCETCNTYNMLKLTQLLFELTKDRKYADFYERTWLNAILSSQNPDTGMTMYFQPMATGYFKVYSRPYDQFWCCTGTGMENFTKLSEGIFYHDEKNIYINRYISGELNWEDEGVSLKMLTNFPDLSEIMLQYDTQKPSNLYLIIPKWADEFIIEVDGKEVVYAVKEGYAVLPIEGKGNLQIKCPMHLHYESLPDAPHSVAFMYGPIVLSAKLGQEKMDTTITGVDVTVPLKDIFIKDYILIEDKTPEEWLVHLEKHLKQKENTLEFILQGSEEALCFVPHYSQHTERYGVYWKLCQKGSEEEKNLQALTLKKWQLLTKTIDCIPIGNDQYELAHHIRGEHTEVSSLNGHRYRHIKEGGWVEYEMQVKETGSSLNIVYSGEDEDSHFDILINGKLLVHEHLEKKEGAFYTKQYELAPECLEGKDKIVIQIQVVQGFCRIFDELFIN